MKVFEGYGQTEGTACQTLTLPGETTAGHVGPPIPSIQMKLVDVPDMNYYAANGEGEVSDFCLQLFDAGAANRLCRHCLGPCIKCMN